MFPWAKFRRAKGGVKAHVLLDHDDYLPAYVLLTEAKRSDVKLADSFTLNPGSIVTMDRGYTDYALFGRWTLAGVFFVTRMKENAAFTVETKCEVPANRNIRRRPDHSTHGRPRLRPIVPAHCAAWSFGMRITSERLCCSPICSISARPRSPPSTRSAGRSNYSSRTRHGALLWMS